MTFDLRLYDAHDDGALATHLVLMAVTIVVDHQEIVGGESHCKAGNQERGVPLTCRYHIICEDHRNEAKEDEDEEVAPTEIGEMGGVEEAEEDAEDAHKEQFPLQVEQQDSKSNTTRKEGHHSDAPLHSTRCDPPLCTSTLWSQTVFTICALLEIKVVVNEVGIDLHEDGEEKTEEDRGKR